MTAMLNMFAAWKSLVDQATENNEAATPGYIYAELSKKTYESSSVCESIQDYLLKRLATDSAVVKLKALRVIKCMIKYIDTIANPSDLIDKGNRHFKRDLTRRVDLLRDAASYRGPPDPLRGDAPYRLVREEAHLVINNLFTADAPRDDGPMGGGGGGGGGGGDPHHGFPQTDAPTPKKYEGMQNPNIVPEKSMLATVSEKMSSVKEAVTAHLPFNFEPTAPKPSSGHVPWTNLTNPGLPPGPQTSTYQPVVLDSSSPHVAGKPAGAWDMQRTAPSPSAPAPRGNASKPSAASAVAAPRAAPAQVAADEGGDLEARIVEEATQAAGVRSVPTRDQLNSFVSRCATLDCWLVAESLDDALASPAWQSRLKALCYIEAMLNATNSDIMEYFTSYGDKLQDQLNSPQASVRERAQRVINFIVPPSPEDTTTASNGAATSAAAPPGGSIFDGGIFAGLDQQVPADEPEEQLASLSIASAPPPAVQKRVARRVRPAPGGAAAAEPIVETTPVVVTSPASSSQTSAARRTSSGRRRQSHPEEVLFDAPTPSKTAAKAAPPALSEIDRELLGLPPASPVAKAPSVTSPAMTPVLSPMAATPMGVPMGYPPYYPAPYPYAAPYPYPMAMPPGYALPPGYMQPGYGMQPQANGALPQLPTILPPSHGSSLLSSTQSTGGGSSDAGFGFVNSSSNGGKEVSFDWVKDTVKTQATAGKASS